MEPIKAIYDSFWNKDDSFQNEAEMFRNIVCTDISRNTTSALATPCISSVLDSLPLLLLLSLVFLYSSNLQASVQKHLYKPVTYGALELATPLGGEKAPGKSLWASF